MPVTEITSPPTAASEPAQPVGCLLRLASPFVPPRLPPVSRRAFRFHMVYAVLDAISAGILSNGPVIAVKALHATDAQLQLPLAMASVGMFTAIFTGEAMAALHKKPFVIVPGVLAAISALLMGWTTSAVWFLCLTGMVSIFDFAARPAVPPILRIVYPGHCCSHVAGTLRQYSSVIFLASNLFFAWLLSASDVNIIEMMHIQFTLACLLSLTAYICFQQLPNHGDGSSAEAEPHENPEVERRHWKCFWASFTPLRDQRFRRFAAVFFLYAASAMFYVGIIPAFLAKDFNMGYVQAALLIHIVPGIAGFITGGRLCAWFDRTSISKSWKRVAALWGLDPILLASAPLSPVLLPLAWPVLMLARISRGIAQTGSFVLAWFTGIHSFARPGPDTSRYMAVQLCMNGLARLAGPTATALLVTHCSHRVILFCGGIGVLTASILYGFIESRNGSSDYSKET